jgi:hypothetical protein
MYELPDLDYAEESEEIELKDDADIAYAKSHCGVISASKVYALATYQPNQDTIEQLKADISELENKIANSTSGRVKTATDALESKQRQLDRMLSDELPDGAVSWCEDLAMMRMTGFCEESDVSFDSKETRWGKVKEALAIDKIKQSHQFYDFCYTCESQMFIKLDGFEYVGATPDSVIFDYESGNKIAVLDVKCPFNRKIHFLKYGRIQSYAQFKQYYPMYYWQGVLQMMCAKVDKFMFASYDPRYESVGKDLFVYEFDLVQSDADFLRSRIEKAEQLISELMENV